MKRIFFSSVLIFLVNLITYAQPDSWNLLLSDHGYNKIVNDSNGDLYASFLNTQDSSYVIKSTDQGSSWDTILVCSSSLSFPADIFIDTIFSSHDRIIVSSYTNPNYLSSDYGLTWEEFNAPGGIFDFESTGDMLCFGFGNYNLYHSDDNGANWDTLNLPEPTYTDFWLSGIEVDIYDNIYVDILYGRNNFPPHTWNEVYKSTDEGITWNLFFRTEVWGSGTQAARIYSTAAGDLFIIDENNFPDYTTHHLKNGNIHHYDFYAYSPWQVKGDQIYLLNAYYPWSPKALFSPDSGASWIDISSGLSEYMQNGFLCNDSFGYLYAEAAGKIFKTTFTTTNIFSRTALNFGKVSLNDTSYIPIKLQNPFEFNISIDSVISYDSHFFVTGLQNNIIAANDTISAFIGYAPGSLDTNQTYIYLYSEYIDARIHILGLGINPSSIRTYDGPASEFKLIPNYPNPFNPTTKIRFQLPEFSRVVLKVYDLLGREIKTLVNEEKPAGSYELEFDGANLSGGVYFYQLRAGGFVKTRKMILLK